MVVRQHLERQKQSELKGNRSEEKAFRAQSSNNESKILEAAEHVFATYGFRGATTAMIAAKAGVTKPNIYYYFRNKEALYRKLLQHILSVWADSLGLIDAEKPPEECLRAYLTRKMEFSRTRPQLSRIFANEIISGAPYIRDHISRNTRPLLVEKTQVIEGWIKQGLINPGIEPTYLIFMMWASTQAYADFAAQMQILLAKRHLEKEDFSAALDTITEVVLRGALRVPERQSAARARKQGR